MAIGDIYKDKYGNTYTEKYGEVIPVVKRWDPTKRRFLYYRNDKHGRLKRIPFERVLARL